MALLWSQYELQNPSSQPNAELTLQPVQCLWSIVLRAHAFYSRVQSPQMESVSNDHWDMSDEPHRSQAPLTKNEDSHRP
jgi:hypothetical protein